MNPQEKKLMECARTYIDAPANPSRRDELCAAAISFMLHTLNNRLGLLSPKEQADVIQTMSLTEQLIFAAMQHTLSSRLPEHSLTNFQSTVTEKKVDHPSVPSSGESRHGRARNRT